MNPSFYVSNRAGLYETLPDGSLFAICSGTNVHRTADDDYRFIANRNFYYLTGVDDPDCVLFAFKLRGDQGKAREYLEKTEQADPTGTSGEEARRLLDQMNAVAKAPEKPTGKPVH